MSKLIKTIITVAVGVGIGFVIQPMVNGGEFDFYMALLLGLIFSGIVYGWKFMNATFGTLLSGNIVIMLIGLVIKIIGAIVVGWIILFVEIVKGIIEVISERKNIELS